MAPVAILKFTLTRLLMHFCAEFCNGPQNDLVRKDLSPRLYIIIAITFNADEIQDDLMTQACRINKVHKVIHSFVKPQKYNIILYYNKLRAIY